MAIIRVEAGCSTIQVAIDAALPGDEILVGDGIYHEQVTVSKSFITIIGGEKTVLDGQWKLAAAFTLEGTSGVEIRSFIIKNYTDYGVDIQGGAFTNTVSQVRFVNIGTSCVKQDAAATASRIVGCTIAVARYGIEDLGSHLCIENCRILYCHTGVECGESSVDASVSCCEISFSAYGVIARGALARVTDNRLHRNRSSSIAINGTGSQVARNEVKDNERYTGISIAGEGNTVKENRLYSNGGYGIYVISGVNSVIGNRVYDSGDVGIYIESEGNEITGNEALRNGNYDIARVLARNLIQDNICCKSSPPGLCRECSCEETGWPSREEETVIRPAADRRVPEEYPTIQQAVDAASPGDVICVGRGAYREQVTIGKDGLRIIGEKGTILDGEGRLDAGFILNRVREVEIQCLCIRGYRTDGIDILGGGGNTVKQVGVFDCYYYGVFLDSATEGNRILGSTMEGNRYGIYDGSSGLCIEESRMAYSGVNGIRVIGTGTRIINTTVEFGFDNGIVSTGSGICISGCRIRENLQSGAEIQDDSVVEDSELCFNNNHGVELLGKNNTVRNNELSSNGYYGLFSSNLGGNEIRKNRMNNNKLYGLSVLSNNLVEENSAHGNRIYDMVRVETNSIFRNNDCEKSLPPWICCGGELDTKEASYPMAVIPAASIVVPTDYATIQAAVDAALPGDIILVKSGVYHEQVTVGRSQIKIIGEEKTVLDGEGSLESAFVFRNASDVVLQSLTVMSYTTDGIVATEESQKITLSCLCVKNCYYGITLDRSTKNCLLIGSSITGNGAPGIRNFCSNMRVEDCLFSYNASSAIVAYCDSITLLRNAVHHNLGNGINSNVTGSAVIVGNSVCYNRYSTVIAYGTSLIKDNEVSNNYSNGISAVGQHSIVEGNRVCGNEQGGISIYNDSRASGNEVRDNGGYGLYAANSGNVVECNELSGNKDYDIVINQSGNRAGGNICGISVPPWICGGRCAERESPYACQ